MHISGLWQAGVVRRTRPLNRGTLMMPLAQAMNIVREPRPYRRAHAHRQPAFKVMPRPAPESETRGPLQPGRHEEKPSRGLLVTASGNMITATRASAHDGDGIFRKSTMETHTSKRIASLETADNLEAHRREGRSDRDPMHAPNWPMTFTSWRTTIHDPFGSVAWVATCGWPGRAKKWA